MMTVRYLQPRCEWCDRVWILKVGPGRVPKFCKGACRTALCRARALDLADPAAGGAHVREGRQAAIARRVRRDEQSRRRAK